MNTYRKTAITIGILFIVCTIASILGPSLAISVNSPDYLNQLVFAIWLIAKGFNQDWKSFDHRVVKSPKDDLPAMSLDCESRLIPR
jgi:hypothetical protein